VGVVAGAAAGAGLADSLPEDPDDAEEPVESDPDAVSDLVVAAVEVDLPRLSVL